MMYCSNKFKKKNIGKTKFSEAWRISNVHNITTNDKCNTIRLTATIYYVNCERAPFICKCIVWLAAPHFDN